MMSDEKKESGLPWLGFWLFLSVVVLLRPDLISPAFHHSDENERTLTELKIEELKLKIAIKKQGLTDKVNDDDGFRKMLHIQKRRRTLHD